MATPKTIEIACWNRRFVNEEEMRSLLNLKKPQWKRFRMSNPLKVKPNEYGKFDRDVVEPIFAKQ